MVTSNLDDERIRRGGKGRGEHERVGKGGGGGSGRLIQEGMGIKTEKLWKWDNSKSYKVAKLTKKGQILLYLWPLFRVCNTTTLLCARFQEKYTGQEEEED